MKSLILILLIAFTAFSQDCTPFGARTFFGRSYISTGSQELFCLKFNTPSHCPMSFVRTKQESITKQFNCTAEEIKITNKTTFITYVHSCSIVDLKASVDIEYSVYGVSSTGQQTLYKNSSILLTMVDKDKADFNRFIVLADWSKIVLKPYISLDGAFADLRRNNRTSIHGVILIGDIGYDLETNECQNYIDFLTILTWVAEVWPVITVTGNHEYVSKNNWKMYNQSFQMYSLTDENMKIQSFNFKLMSILAFDLYNQIYGLATVEQTQIYLKKLEAEMQKINLLKKRWYVSSSHYPLICSASTKNCTGDNQTLSSFWFLLNQYHYSLYLGAHTHIYERIYPYYMGKFTPVEGPYVNVDSLVSIVEGVAGNEKDIVEEKYKYKTFTAKGTVNETGYGIMTVFNTTHLEYKHYSTKDGLHEADSVMIIKSAAQQQMLRRHQVQY